MMPLSVDSPLPRQRAPRKPKSDFPDPWNNLYIPKRLETVRALSYDCRQAVVIEVDPQRKRALVHIEDDGGSARFWEYCSMLGKNTPLYLHPSEFLQLCPRRPGVWTSSFELYSSYCVYCARRNRSPFTPKRFGMCVRETGAVRKFSYFLTPRGREWVRGWIGITTPAGF